MPLGRRAGVVRRRPLPAVERRAQRPHHALGRDHRAGTCVAARVRPCKRQHARPPGAPRHLRTPGTPRHPHRTRRPHHRAGRPLPGQAPELAQRRRREIRRLDLVHRPAFRHHRLLPGREGRTGNPRRHLSHRPAQRRGRPGLRYGQRPQRAGLLARREAVVRDRIARPPPQRPGVRRLGRRPPAGPAARAVRRRRRHARRLPGRRRRQPLVRLGHGHARARRGLLGRIALPERCANLCFGGKHRNRLFMASCTSIYSLFVNTQGAIGG